MFIEPNITGDKRGWIEVICGSMFSGKTEELIRRLKRAKIANLNIEIYKPALDTRYNEIRSQVVGLRNIDEVNVSNR
jgi:thymidine kinase